MLKCRSTVVLHYASVMVNMCIAVKEHHDYTSAHEHANAETEACCSPMLACSVTAMIPVKLWRVAESPSCVPCPLSSRLQCLIFDPVFVVGRVAQMSMCGA